MSLRIHLLCVCVRVLLHIESQPPCPPPWRRSTGMVNLLTDSAHLPSGPKTNAQIFYHTLSHALFLHTHTPSRSTKTETGVLSGMHTHCAARRLYPQLEICITCTSVMHITEFLTSLVETFRQRFHLFWLWKENIRNFQQYRCFPTLPALMMTRLAAWKSFILLLLNQFELFGSLAGLGSPGKAVPQFSLTSFWNSKAMDEILRDRCNFKETDSV